jgi:hypothetical protein
MSPPQIRPSRPLNVNLPDCPHLRQCHICQHLRQHRSCQLVVHFVRHPSKSMNSQGLAPKLVLLNQDLPVAPSALTLLLHLRDIQQQSSLKTAVHPTPTPLATQLPPKLKARMRLSPPMVLLMPDFCSAATLFLDQDQGDQ